MGEIAEDCYDRALDELDMLEHDPDYFGYGGGLYRGDTESPGYIPRRYLSRRPPPPPKPTTADDFDDLDDLSDLI